MLQVSQTSPRTTLAAQPSAARPSAPAAFEVSSFTPARARAISPAARSPDGLRTWAELSAGQQAMFGQGGAATYAKLSTEQRGIFLVLSARMEQTGVDLSRLRLDDPVKNIRPNRMLLSKDAGMDSLRADLERNIRSGQYNEFKPFGLFHGGYDDFGTRDNRDTFTMQIGMGKDGAFVDVDHFYPRGAWGWLRHIGEILIPGKPSAQDVASALGIDIRSHA